MDKKKKKLTNIETNNEDETHSFKQGKPNITTIKFNEKKEKKIKQKISKIKQKITLIKKQIRKKVTKFRTKYNGKLFKLKKNNKNSFEHSENYYAEFNNLSDSIL